MSSILDAIGRTPLVPLNRVAPGVWGKCEHMNPGGSLKDRIAVAIVNAAEGAGLRRGDTLIEATAGNTGVGLALVAAIRGYRLVCVMPEKMAEEKRALLRALGAEVVITPNAPPDAPRNFQNVARRMAAENGWFLTDQFANPANPWTHESTTGPELWEQTGGEIAAFVAGVGTGGTLTGVGRYLKRKNPDIVVVLADPLGSRLAGLVNDGELGCEAPYAVEGIGSSAVPPVFDPSVVDFAVSVSDRESFEVTRRLAREEGLLVGGSSGGAVAAALAAADRVPLDGPIVAVLADSWDRYWSKMFDPAWLAAL